LLGQAQAGLNLLQDSALRTRDKDNATHQWAMPDYARPLKSFVQFGL
jgi:hypothetical protein